MPKIRFYLPAIFVLFFLISIFSVFGYSYFNCSKSNNPDIVPFGSFNWVCNITGLEIDENIRCLSYTQDMDKQILDVNPKPEDIDNYGRIDSFSNNYGLVNIKFDTKNLKHGVQLQGCVICSNASGFQDNKCFNITPKYKDLEGFAIRTQWLGENASYVIFGMIILILITLGVFLIKAGVFQ